MVLRTVSRRALLNAPAYRAAPHLQVYLTGGNLYDSVARAWMTSTRLWALDLSLSPDSLVWVEVPGGADTATTASAPQALATTQLVAVSSVRLAMMTSQVRRLARGSS